MLHSIDCIAKKLNHRERFLGALSLLVFTGIIDYFAGPEFSMTLFYLAAIVTVAWCGGAIQGAIISVLASATLVGVELLLGKEYTSSLILVWNLAANIALFMIVTALVVVMRQKMLTLMNLALTDPLTGLSNRRYFHEQLEREVARVRRYPETFTLAYIDLDDFKAVNDNHGHAVGDTLLQEVGRVLRENLREADLAARLGGDEFAVLFPALHEQPATLVIEKLRDSLHAAMLRHSWPVTFSIGVVTYHEPVANIRDMVKKADDLMYEVKKSGKDSVVHISCPKGEVIRTKQWGSKEVVRPIAGTA